MKELVARGPVTAVLNVPSYFQMYQEGILQEECEVDSVQISHVEKPPSRLQTKHRSSAETLWERDIEWEYVNHSIVIVGYGTTDDPEEKKDRTGRKDD